MTTVTVDIEGARHMGVAETKASLRGMVTDVEHSGSVYVIERYGRPAALLVPLPTQRQSTRCARGLLSPYVDADRSELEEGAFARAMEAKHGDHAA